MAHQGKCNPVEIAFRAKNSLLWKYSVFRLCIFETVLAELLQCVLARTRDVQRARQDEFFLCTCHGDVENAHLLCHRLALNDGFDFPSRHGIVFLPSGHAVLIDTQTDALVCMVEQIAPCILRIECT